MHEKTEGVIVALVEELKNWEPIKDWIDLQVGMKLRSAFENEEREITKLETLPREVRDLGIYYSDGTSLFVSTACDPRDPAIRLEYCTVNEKLKGIIAAVIQEFKEATSKFKGYNSAHEGYAVILEELDELWDEVKKKKKSKERMREEAIQVAVTAIRFVHDVIGETEE